MEPDPLGLITGGLFTTSGVGQVTHGFQADDDSASHIHQRVSNYVIAKLRAAASEAADRIHDDSSPPLQARELKWDLPAIQVFTRNEESEIFTESPRELRCTLELAIDIITGGKLGDDQRHAIASVVQALIGPDRQLGGHVDDHFRTNIAKDSDHDGVARIYVMRLVFSVFYREEQIVDVGEALKAIHVNWDLGPAPDEQIEAEDELEFEE